MECLDNIDLQTLRDACKVNNLPTSGTKLDCFHRLKSGAGDGRKNKGKGVAATDDVTTSTSPPSPGFIAKEYAALKEAGIEEEEEIENIINMRWKKMQALKMASEEEAEVDGDVDVEKEAEAEADFAFIKIPMKLTPEQAVTSNYIFVSGPDEEGCYRYKKIDKPEPAAKPVAKAASSKAASKSAVKAVPAKSPTKAFTVGKKRKEPEPEPQPLSADDPAFQQAAIQFCMKKMKSRIMAKIKDKQCSLKKENLFDFILAFDAGTKGTTEDVVDTFIEQSLCETDDEDE